MTVNVTHCFLNPLFDWILAPSVGEAYGNPAIEAWDHDDRSDTACVHLQVETHEPACERLSRLSSVHKGILEEWLL